MQRLKEDIKQKIIEIGKFKFKTVGFENTSMKDIANDVGISTGNIYRYFITKNHLLNEILEEIEIEIKEFFEKIPSEYEKIDIDKTFDALIDLTIKIACEKGDTLSILLNTEKESKFLEFRDNVVQIFNKKMITIIDSIHSNKKIDAIVLMSISRAEFEGFSYIVKNNINDTKTLKENLIIYKKVMVKDLGNKFMEVVKND